MKIKGEVDDEDESMTKMNRCRCKWEREGKMTASRRKEAELIPSLLYGSDFLTKWVRLDFGLKTLKSF